MTAKTALFIFILATLGVALELFVYFSTGMAQALNATGLAQVAAYKFLWLTVATGAAGVLAPIGALVTGATQRKNLGLASWVVLTGIIMLGYTTFSFVNAPKPEVPSVGVGLKPVPTLETQPIPAPEPPAPPASTAAKKITEVLELADSKIEQLDPEKIRVTLQFRNKSIRRITEIDYAFTFVDDTNRVLMSIDLREGVFIPPGLAAESTLDWTQAGFKDPAQFDALATALAGGKLKTSVVLQGAKLDDGTTAEG